MQCVVSVCCRISAIVHKVIMWGMDAHWGLGHMSWQLGCTLVKGLVVTWSRKSKAIVEAASILIWLASVA